MVGYPLPETPPKPAWLEALLTDRFFVACPRHLEIKKNENNIFCVDCSKSICQHCLPNHQSHRLLQVRRYVYHDVIRLLDIQKLLDCSQVQTYIINSAKVVFLNQRPQSRPAKGLANSCQTCDRSLAESYRYCSVSCKVDAALNKDKSLSRLINNCSSLTFPDIFTYSPREGPKQVEEELSPTSVLEETSSGSTANDLRWMLPCPSIDMPLLKKICRRVAAPESAPTRTSGSRRKGIPHRSPIY
ncbi:protein RGF1 INDUCIBLE TRANSCRIPTION FACTOR 1 [Cryptomeria japonica]|uniref:Putative zinc-binding protein n=1 Tax=Cryptomeria japonica TaxID=3369 RepID=Q1XG53_CRYJA|nr:protein RGF1 INDUCIBLE TRANSCRIPTION FACTOR 1 [Cryptomeria japonica]BAE92295.1 putative zinc-binding protein [Cryptomeria japonica]